ncbi:MAG: substrate-binding domain-containing protein [Candidatus Pacebacteria bacterium]|nr:substrate-binding domain-containing protein [Candidatus Paceibacterota bacterium]
MIANRSNKPKYLWIKEAILERIRYGEYTANQQLPSRDVLSSEFNTTMATCSRAIEELRLEGVIDCRNGVGTFVSKQLPGYHSTKVCIVIPNVALPFYCHFLDVTVHRLQETSYICGNVGIVGRDEQNETTLVRRFLQQRESVIFLKRFQRSETRDLILESPERFYVFGDAPELVGRTNLLRSRLPAGTRLAVEHLLAFGHRRIAFVGPTGDGEMSQHLAWRKTLIDHRVNPDRDLEYVLGDFESLDRASRNQRIGAILDTMCSLAEAPTAVFAYSHSVAVHLISMAERRGITVPDKLSVCGFDAGASEGPGFHHLTAVHLPLEPLVNAAINHLSLPHPRFLDVWLTPDLVIGDTTGPVGAEHGLVAATAGGAAGRRS